MSDPMLFAATVLALGGTPHRPALVEKFRVGMAGLRARRYVDGNELNGKGRAATAQALGRRGRR